MYVATAILFILPCSLLFFAWKSVTKAGTILALPTWRSYVIKAALWIAALAKPLNIIWNVSWLHSGGSPHGMGLDLESGNLSALYW
ncbi:MAG TPA: hypothetical protein VFN26_16255 [Candidatus Acidoferrum sp.]|nr:hypothetical protein [Candidatus Acidoferrum sp.]